MDHSYLSLRPGSPPFNSFLTVFYLRFLDPEGKKEGYRFGSRRNLYVGLRLTRRAEVSVVGPGRKQG